MNWPNSTYSKTSSNATYCGSIYRFVSTGKERDEETGYNYHGARYYDANLLTSWLSVDPMADKYPGISPYNYCAWNPMKLVDPDGETPRIYVEQTGVGHAFMTVGEGKNTIGEFYKLKNC